VEEDDVVPRGGGAMPPLASMPEGSNPQGEEQVI
jgi:hypothetical protein